MRSIVPPVPRVIEKREGGSRHNRQARLRGGITLDRRLPSWSAEALSDEGERFLHQRGEHIRTLKEF